MAEQLLRILMVEDESEYADIIKRMLEKQAPDLQVSLAGSIGQAIELIPVFDPDLIIADIMLPDGRGIDLLDHSDIQGKIPVLVMTGFGDEQLAVEAMKKGAMDYMSKSLNNVNEIPSVAKRVMEEWHHIIERKKTQAELEAYRLHLEELVASRTAEIQQTNIRLQSEIEERKKAEEQLRITQFSVDHMNDAAYWVNINAEFIYANQAACEMLGYSKQELLGMTVLDIDPALDRKKWMKHWRGLKKGERQRFDTLHRRKDGSLVDVELSANYIRFGGYEYNCAFARDITKRKQTEVKLRESEALYHTLVDASPYTVTMSDLEGNITYASKNTLALHGFEKEEELLGKSALSLIAPEDYERSIANLKRTLKEGIIFGEEYTLLRKNGEPFKGELSAALIRDGNGNPKAFIATVRDITDRKEWEDALKASEEKYRTIAENVNVGIYRNTPGPKGRFIEVNPAFMRMFGWENKKEMDRVNVSDLYMNPESRLQFSERLSMEGFVKDEEIQLKRKDGTAFWVAITAAAVHDEAGKVKYYDGVIEDITDRKKAEEKIRASLHEKEMLLKEIHHRVKNNMQVIKSLLNLQCQQLKDPGVVDIFRECQNRIHSMALIHEKLYGSQDFTRIDFKEYVNRLARDLYRSYCISIDRVELRVEAQAISLGLDTALPCGLVINELLSNALKYAFPAEWLKKGIITVSLARAMEDRIEIVVSDNGVGIPKDLAIDKADSLGLRLVRIIVEDQLDGTLEVKSEGGTLFRITFREVLAEN